MYLGIHLQSIIYFFLNKYFVISYSEAYVALTYFSIRFNYCNYIDMHLMLRYFL